MKGKGFVLAALAAGAASYLSKKENRDKVTDYLNQAKTKVNENGGVQGLLDKAKNAATKTAEDVSDKAEEVTGDLEGKLEEVASTAGSEEQSEIDGNQMLDEGGGQQAIDAFNESQDKDSK